MSKRKQNLTLKNINNSSSRNDAVTIGGAAPAGTPRTLLIVYNPVAGWRRRHLLDAVVLALRARSVEVVIRPTTARGDAERFARAARAGGFDRLIVAGGDGTINEAINGLAGSDVPLAIVPMGTANVLAAEIGLAGDAEAIAAAALDGPVARVSLGMVGQRRFAMMAGIGFDAHVVRTVDPAIKRRLGKLAYVLATAMLLGRYRRPRYTVLANGRRFVAGAVILAKGQHYAGRFVCAPDARLEAPSLELCLFRAGSRLAILRYALALALGRIHRQYDVEILSIREAEIEGPPDDPVQGDGDLIGQLPARIAVAPETLLLSVPRASPLLCR